MNDDECQFLAINAAATAERYPTALVSSDIAAIKELQSSRDSDECERAAKVLYHLASCMSFWNILGMKDAVLAAKMIACPFRRLLRHYFSTAESMIIDAVCA